MQAYLPLDECRPNICRAKVEGSSVLQISLLYKMFAANALLGRGSAWAHHSRDPVHDR